MVSAGTALGSVHNRAREEGSEANTQDTVGAFAQGLAFHV